MRAEGKAVFLSYASQNAEAAKRICEALRSGGVEVWLDAEGGLEHGDEWDAKIRRQIKECLLFIPLISSNTQARHEGYFRIEWDLAAERARGIASGVPFILPVVIDDTREPDALVPDRFRAVQWTRLPGGIVPPEVQARFLKLWSHRTGVVSHQSAQTEVASSRTESSPTQSKRRAFWLVPVIAGVLAITALVMWQPWKGSDSDLLARPELVERAPRSSLPATAPTSEARQLVAKAWTLMARPEMAREELDAADDLCKRAAALDPNDAEVWAAWSQVDSWYVYHRLERTPARQDGARTKAARALNLSPRSYEARLAQACYLVREGGGQDAVYDLVEAEGLLQSLLRENADEPRALLALGVLCRNTGKVAGFRDAFGRMARTPAFAAQAYSELGWAEFFNGNYREAEAAVDASIKLQPYYSNLNLKTYLFAYWWGDLEQAHATLERLPAANLLEDYAVSTLIQLSYWQRQPDAMLRVLDRLSRDWLESNAFDGPKAWWSGLARHMAGQDAAAQLQWRTALQLVERRLADQPDSGFLLRWKARLQLACGDRTEGEKALRLARELGSRGHFSDEATDEILLGNKDAAVATLERRVEDRERFLNAAILRLSPAFDPLRDKPRFQALLARMEADPRFSPMANQWTEDGGPSFAKASDGTQKTVPSLSLSLSPSTPPDAKSVAVLAFANLSDDKGNEYFSDGVSEELLNVLAKVPGLKVTARTSAFYFKGKQVPIADIAQQLGVAYVIEGSVRKAGDRVRISAQLIKASDGFQVWSDTFTRDLKDIFAVQDEIAGLVAQQLQLKLGTTGVARVVDPEAHRLLLEARYHWYQRGEENFDRAETLLNRALAIDPDFAPAHAAMADLWVVRAIYRSMRGIGDLATELRSLRASAARATELDSSLVAPIWAVALGLLLEGRMEASRQQFEAAFALSPDDPTIRYWHGLFLMKNGDFEASRQEGAKARELDPKAWIVTFFSGECALALGRQDEAIALFRQADDDRADGFLPAVAHESLALWLAGRSDEAVAAARTIRQSWPRPPRWQADIVAVWVLREAGLETEVAEYADALFAGLPEQSYQRGFVLAALGRLDEALPFLERTNVLSLDQLAWLPIFNPWRNDPRFTALIEKLHWTAQYAQARKAMKNAKLSAR